MLKTVLSLLLLLAMTCAAFAQDSIPPEISVAEKGDSVHFSARLRPLRQIAGAPSAFYTYFWELGDGHFSFDSDPSYVYKDTGLYQVRLYATNNYDDGKAPPTRPHPVKIKKKGPGTSSWAAHFFHSNGNIEIRVNRNPRPGEDFVAVIGYRSQSADSLGGSIALFYNERLFGQDAFSLADKRFYNGEDSSSINRLMAARSPQRTDYDAPTASIQMDDGAGWQADRPIQTDGSPEDEAATETRSMLHTLQTTYKQHTVLHFSSIHKGEEKFVFMDLNTLPGMLQDTNATVAITAILVPDDPARSPELYELEVPVVASHDPNHMQIKPRRINYRFMGKKKELTYTVQFQNTGQGPARKISIGIAIPRQLDISNVQVKNMSPTCRSCDSVSNGQSCIDTVRHGDSLYFVFKNIYLPGLQQYGVNDQDSTKGFVTYSIRFKKKPKKIPFNTQAAIIFDKNAPVITNKATAKFIKGISPGIMAGYVYSPANGSYSTSGPLEIGYVLAPYAPSRPFFQIEAFAGLLQQNKSGTGVVKVQQDTVIGGLKYLVTGRESKTTVKYNSFEVTPLHYRYNIGNWVGVGLGAQVMVNISEQTTTENKIYFITQLLPLNTNTSSTFVKSNTKWLGTWNAAPFADLQVGRVRNGPVLGLRYLRLLKGDVTNRFFMYAGFKL